MATLGAIREGVATSDAFTRPVTLDVAGVPVECRLRLVPADPSVFGRVSAMQDAETEEDLTAGRRACADLLAALVVSWDLEGDDGAPLPIAGEGLAGIDFDVVLALVHAVVEAVGDAPKGHSGSSKRPPKPKVSSRKS